MAARRRARDVGQQRLDPPNPPTTGAAEAPAEPPDVPPTDPPKAPIEEMPGGSAAELRERQRRWFKERARYEAYAAARDAPGDRPAG